MTSIKIIERPCKDCEYADYLEELNMILRATAQRIFPEKYGNLLTDREKAGYDANRVGPKRPINVCKARGGE